MKLCDDDEKEEVVLLLIDTAQNQSYKFKVTMKWQIYE